MKNKLPTVTVGIPAYNEEKNINNLLLSIIAQEEKGFIIEKVIIISDGSTDKTNEIISTFKNPILQLIINKTRQGQIYSQNTIFSLANTDVVVLFEADSCPKDDTFLEELLKPILENNDIGFVQGNPQPLRPIKLFEKVLYAQDASYYKFAKEIDRPEDMFISGGAGRAFAKKVYKKLIWPKDVPEDSYAFHWLKTNKIKMVFQQEAICFYRLPQSLKDHLMKRQKVISGQIALDKYFSKKNINFQYSLPRFLIIKIAIYFFITQPNLFFGYLFVKFLEKWRLKKDQFTDYWNNVSSTKALFQQN